MLLVHELGHSIARFAQGNRFMQFAAGPLQVRRETGVVRVRFNRSAGLCGGVAASMPRVSAGATLKENLFRVALWGPLASLLLAAVTAAALRARVDQLADTSLDGVMLHLTRFEHALDVDDRPRAATHMAAVRAAREGLAPTLRSHVALESAYWVAVGKGAAACARQEFGDAAESPFTTKVSRVRTEGAVLLIEGDKSA